MGSLPLCQGRKPLIQNLPTWATLSTEGNKFMKSAICGTIQLLSRTQLNEEQRSFPLCLHIALHHFFKRLEETKRAKSCQYKLGHKVNIMSIQTQAMLDDQ